MTQSKAETLSTVRACVAAGLAVLALSGCSDFKRAIGYEKAPPDEFQVVARAPLSMPPDFTLRPPAPGTVRPQDGTTRDQARAALLGDDRQVAPLVTAGLDKGDLDLLKRAGADNAQPGIRDLVDKESLALAKSNRSFADKLIFWRKADIRPGAGEVLDAVGEARRLQRDKAQGRPLTAGHTPRIERGDTGLLDELF